MKRIVVSEAVVVVIVIGKKADNDNDNDNDEMQRADAGVSAVCGVLTRVKKSVAARVLGPQNRHLRGPSAEMGTKMPASCTGVSELGR
jgi:hypothetical protein